MRVYQVALAILFTVTQCLFSTPGFTETDLLDLHRNYEKITIQVGQKHVLKTSTSRRILVSRRGIIHILEGEGGISHITGLRTGVVAVTIQERSGIKKTVYVEVLPKEDPKHFSNIDRHQDETHPSKIGETIPSDLFRVQADVDLLETQSLETFGKDFNSLIGFNLAEQTLTSSATSSLEAKAHNIQRTVIAKPNFLVQENADSIIRSGGETVQEKLNQEGHSIPVWQEYGMTLNVRLERGLGEQLLADILFLLKSPSSSATDRYSVNQIQTRTQIKLDERVLIGTVDLATDDATGKKDIFLSQIPIIGPLFRTSSASKANAKVQLWFMVSKL